MTQAAERVAGRKKPHWMRQSNVFQVFTRKMQTNTVLIRLSARIMRRMCKQTPHRAKPNSADGGQAGGICGARGHPPRAMSGICHRVSATSLPGWRAACGGIWGLWRRLCVARGAALCHQPPCESGKSEVTVGAAESVGYFSQPMQRVSKASLPSVRCSRRSSSFSASFSPRLSFLPL